MFHQIQQTPGSNAMYFAIQSVIEKIAFTWKKKKKESGMSWKTEMYIQQEFVCLEHVWQFWVCFA